MILQDNCYIDYHSLLEEIVGKKKN